MAASFSERQEGPVTILVVSGWLTVGPDCDAFGQKLQSLIASGRRALLLDCHGVVSIDSQGIAALLRGYTSMRRAGGQIKLVGCTGRTHRVLDIVRLTTVLDCFDDVDKAVQSFASFCG